MPKPPKPSTRRISNSPMTVPGWRFSSNMRLRAPGRCLTARQRHQLLPVVLLDLAVAQAHQRLVRDVGVDAGRHPDGAVDRCVEIHVETVRLDAVGLEAAGGHFDRLLRGDAQIVTEGVEEPAGARL